MYHNLKYFVQKIDLTQINFEERDKIGDCIFGNLIEQAVRAQKKLEIQDPKAIRLLAKTEEAFFFLLAAAEEKLGKEKLYKMLETPEDSGQTLFMKVSVLSEKIATWILDREIDVNYIDHDWSYPQFKFDKLVSKMIDKGISLV